MNTNKIIKYPHNRLRSLRIQRGLLQRQVAELLALQCENRLSLWEQGISAPNLENLAKLAKLYQVLPHDLYPLLFPEYAPLQLTDGMLHRGPQMHQDTGSPSLL